MDKDLTIKLRLDRTQATQANKQFVADQKASEKEILSDTQASERAKAALASQTSRDRIKAAVQTMQAEREATKAATSGFAEMKAAASGFGSTLQSLAGGIVSIGALTGAARTFTNIMAEANQEASNQVENLMKTKNLIREIVMIQGGKEGPTDAEVQRFMKLRVASGLSAEGAAKFGLEFEGAGAASRGQNISDVEYERVKPLLARFSAAAGGGPDAAGTYGKLGGLMLGMRKFDKAEDVLAAQTQFNKILSRGVGDNPTLIKQGAQVAGAYLRDQGPGIMLDERELAAVTATASRINPDQAAEIMKSTTRVLRGFSEKWAPLLQSSKITEKDTYSEAAGKLFGTLEGVEKSGRAVDAYLSEQGVDQAGATNIMSMFRNQKFLFNTLSEEGVRPGGQRMTGAAARAELDTKYRSDVTLRTQQSEAALEGAKLETAMPLQYYQDLENQAKERLQRRGEGEDSAAAKMKDWLTGAVGGGWLHGAGAGGLGRQIRVEQEMARMAQERGLEVPGRPNPMSPTGGYSNAYLGWMFAGEQRNAYSALGNEMEIRAKVGNPANRLPILSEQGVMPGGGGKVAVEVDQQTRVVDLLSSIDRKLPDARKGMPTPPSPPMAPIVERPVVQRR